MTSFADLAACETDDPVLIAVRDRAITLLLATSVVQELDELRIAVVDFARATPAVREEYFTPNCMALVQEHGIVVNASFLRDAEIAIRAMGLSGSVFATPFLRQESEMFGLVRHLRDRPQEYGMALRELASSESERRRRDELALALVFFLGHEIGHLREGEERRGFTTELPEGTALETQLAAATAKYCRHADELRSFGFDLPGFEKVFTRGGEVRAAADAVITSLPKNEVINHDAWFRDESRADACGTEVLLQALQAVEPWKDAAEPGAYLAVRALFAVSVVSWFQDLFRLMQQVCEEVDQIGLSEFMMEMMRDRHNYVRASSVLGSDHRFTLLRAALAMDRVLQSSPAEPTQQRLHIDALQRLALVRLLMDMAVKLATMGATTAWMLLKDKERGTPQLFRMQFEPLANELSRLQRLGE